MLRQGNGEEEFVVVATVEGAGRHVHVELFSGHGRLVVNGEVLFVDAAAAGGGLADVEHFAGETVADVHHSRGPDAVLAQVFDDHGAGLGLQQTLNEVFATAEIGLCGLYVLCGTRVEDTLLALHQLQPHIGSTEVAADAYQVVLLSTAAIDHLIFGRIAHTGDADGKTREGGCGVAANDVNLVSLASHTDAAVEGLYVFEAEAAANGQAHEQLARRAVHGVNVGEVDHRGFVTEVLERGVLQVEVDALHQHIGGQKANAPVRTFEHGTVVADAAKGGGLLGSNVVGEVAD